MTDVVDEEAWLLASPQKPRHRGARVVVSEVTQPGLGQGNTFVTSWDDMRKK